MKQLVINQNDIYKVDSIEYFKFIYGIDYIHVNTNLLTNDKFKFELIAKHCELDYKGLNKKKLVKLIEESKCLVKV